MENFYDRVARQFGGYALSNAKPRYSSEYPSGDPEQAFLETVLRLADHKLTAVDVGCGDGKFAFGIAKDFAKIIGVDASSELIKIAQRQTSERAIGNLQFIFGDCSALPFHNVSIDVVYNRRGPSFFEEYYRVLIQGGHYVEIGIGEQDARALKEVFGRGQNFGHWHESRLAKDKARLKTLGFTVQSMQDYEYTEYYESPAEFELFLKGVPIFEDFDPMKDKEPFDAYIAGHRTPKGIALPRHRVVYLVQK